ncbi:hypothetical protein B0681_10195 [Moraxella porci DSM 25326]|uniref:Transposase n=1 Tax=Moraxella porci DSM 25326 TaxID=573983 RepID=A0A1T0CL93_9GAMM|nr:hypothetical protein [Moraxella porci]OOS23073.1 hypothetical protein B0681_10195 [Moraxella porci DSM 25326]
MTKQRKQYSNEFKLEMVKLIEEQNQRAVDVAKQICFNGALYAPCALAPIKLLQLIQFLRGMYYVNMSKM